MKLSKKLLSLLLALVMLSSIMMMAGCGDPGDPQDGTQTTDGTGGSGNVSGKTGVYNVVVESAGGMKLEGISVYIYASADKAELVGFGETDADGKASIEAPISSDNVVELQGVPEGYEVKEHYAFSGNTAKIVLSSHLNTDKQLSDISASDALDIGDVMCDFTVTTPDGTKVTLSEVLAQKKVVLLNFWFSTCGPCASEFPYMDEAYQMYQDDAAVIAVDPLEDSSKVATYQASMGLSFPMAACPPAWSQAIKLPAEYSTFPYPTTVVIDRYGVICMIERGALTSLTPFVSIFDHFTADDYQQKLFPNGVADIVTQVKPTYTMDTSENIGAVLNDGEIEVTFRPETDDEYSWPFIITEKNGQSCLKASNQNIASSYAILYAEVTLKAGQAVGFDYLSSTENGADFLHVIVNEEPIFTISGADDVEQWKSCYPCVATEDGVYEIALCYIKDEADDAGDDTVYIKDLRIVDPSQIDTPAYLPRYAATSIDGFEFDYVDIFYNEIDGYYHVGSVNGPLLLADLMGYSQFREEETLWDLVYDGDVKVDGVSIYELMVDYFNYASNSSLSGVCTVNKELAGYLKVIASTLGIDSENENEWLKICKYYQAYGKGAKQLEDPIKGLASFSAYEAKLGKNVSTNYFEYNSPIIPRGKLARFVPGKSGVYRITSRADSQNGVDGWIFDGDRNELLAYEMDERLYNDSDNVSMVFYMKAGQAYYIDIAFWDVYEAGRIYYDIEYIAPSLEHFRLASPGYFTYDTNATGDAMYHLIAGGIEVAMGPDGYYHHVTGKTASGDPILGSIVYADFTGITSLFSNPISTVDARDENGNVIRDENGNVVKVSGMIDMGGFDFSKTEEDLYVLAIMKKYGNDVEATDAYLKEIWGEDYDASAELYQLDDVYAGIYHGKGKDLTGEIKGYLSKMYSGPAKEREGCVAVDQRLAEILQLLMDKYTFADVDNAWIKLCYYYDYLGA